MEAGAASGTALDVAAFRAAHLLLDPPPWVLEDRLALPLLGEAGPARLARFAQLPPATYAGFRLIMVNRSRYTEDRLAAAVEKGIGQYVVLGAGLDSFAYRSPWAPRLRVFEVDHPATQAFKRSRLAAAGIAEPPWVAFVPVEFGRDRVAERLDAAGCDRARPSFVSWLGVTQYLDAEALAAMLGSLAEFAVGSEVVLTHILPPEDRDGLGRAVADAYVPGAARQGEPWLSCLSVTEARDLVEGCGLRVVEQLERVDAMDAFLQSRRDATVFPRLSALLRAVVPPRR